MYSIATKEVLEGVGFRALTCVANMSICPKITVDIRHLSSATGIMNLDLEGSRKSLTGVSNRFAAFFTFNGQEIGSYPKYLGALMSILKCIITSCHIIESTIYYPL